MTKPKPPRKPRTRKIGCELLFTDEYDNLVIGFRISITNTKHARQAADYLTRWADWKEWHDKK